MKTFTKQWQSFDAGRHLSPMLESRIGLAGLQQLNQNQRQIEPRRRLTSPKSKNLNPRVGGRLAAYATLAGVALAAPAIPDADATIVYNVVNLNIPSTTAGIYLRLAPFAFATSPSPVPGWDVNLWGSTAFNAWANNASEPSNGLIGNFTGGSSVSLVDNIPVGTLVDGTWSYLRSNGIETTGPTAFNLNSSNNCIGIRFLNNTTNAINYGWIRISLSATSGSQPRAVVEYAYDDSGAFIITKQVPEPSTFALLGVMAAGAFGVRGWRRRKNATRRSQGPKLEEKKELRA